MDSKQVEVGYANFNERYGEDTDILAKKKVKKSKKTGPISGNQMISSLLGGIMKEKWSGK